MNYPLIRDFLAKFPHHKDVMATIPAMLIFDLIQFSCPYGIKVGGIYKHFKGDRYKVLGFTRSADDWNGEICVRYVQVDDVKHEGTRTISEFLENIDRDDYSGPRFTLVG